MTAPVDALRTISDLTEIINQLWGAPTPGGRLYPAPVERGIVSLRWDEASGLAMSGSIASSAGHTDRGFISGGPDPGSLTWMLVRAVATGWDLLRYDTRYETARYPPTGCGARVPPNMLKPG